MNYADPNGKDEAQTTGGFPTGTSSLDSDSPKLAKARFARRAGCAGCRPKAGSRTLAAVRLRAVIEYGWLYFLRSLAAGQSATLIPQFLESRRAGAPAT